jgi:hypothetical protein
VYAGIDWGYQHAFACEVVAASGSGRLAVIGELYARQRTLDELIPALEDLRAQLHIDDFYADPSEPAYIEQCQAKGLDVRKADNSVLPGITAVSAAIAAGMTVDPACSGLLAELPAYTWKPERGSGELADAPVKAHDDACDALRYAVMAHGAPEPGFLTYWKRLATATTEERGAQLPTADEPACGLQFRTPIPSIAVCGLRAGHSGSHEEG